MKTAIKVSACVISDGQSSGEYIQTWIVVGFISHIAHDLDRGQLTIWVGQDRIRVARCDQERLVQEFEKFHRIYRADDAPAESAVDAFCECPNCANPPHEGACRRKAREGLPV
jgi:hypothetical protein